MKPLIGLTPTPEVKEQEHGTFRLHTLNEAYSKAVLAAGGMPVMLPTVNDDIESLLDRLDGVIITGGGDIDPAIFRQEKHETTEQIDAERDAFELALVHAARKRDMPLFGICRGLQVLNVALGGTLVQDIDALIPDATEHRQQKEKLHHEERPQTAKLADGSHPLRDMVQADEMEINTFHHQCIGDLASGLQAIATSDDDVIEAVHAPDMAFGMAVQWHPELLQHKYDDHAAIFRAFVEAARTYQSRTSNREVPELV